MHERESIEVTPIGEISPQQVTERIARHGLFVGSCAGGGLQNAFVLFETLCDTVCRVPSSNRTPIDWDNRFALLADDGGRIEPHSERAYYPVRPDLALFCCVQPAPKGGGDTLLYDGYRLRERLHPDRIRALLGLCIESELRYPSRGALGSEWPGVVDVLEELRRRTRGAVNVDDDGSIRAIHRSSPLVRTHEGALAFATYASLSAHWPPHLAKPFSEVPELSRNFWESGEQVLSLRAGEFVIVDNWRFMHGRSPFDAGLGRRMLAAFGLCRLLSGKPCCATEPTQCLFITPRAALDAGSTASEG